MSFQFKFNLTPSCCGQLNSNSCLGIKKNPVVQFWILLSSFLRKVFVNAACVRSTSVWSLSPCDNYFQKVCHIWNAWDILYESGFGGLHLRSEGIFIRKMSHRVSLQGFKSPQIPNFGIEISSWHNTIWHIKQTCAG